MIPLLWLIAWTIPALLLITSSPAHHLENALAAWSWFHPMGFDAFGRDLLVTTLRGSAFSMGFAFLALLVTVTGGTLAGAAIAMTRGRIQFFLLRFLEILLAFPSLLLALAWAAIRGPAWDTLIVALVLGTLPSFTRLVYVRAREVLAEEFVLAARSLGAGTTRVLIRHLCPEILALSGIKLPNLFAHALIAEATLSFLGVGAPIGRDTWGSLLAQGKDYLLEAPHIAIGTGIPLVLTVLSLQLLSEQMISGRSKKRSFSS